VIEEKYGFNKMTPKTFVVDEIKGLVLGAIVGGLLLAAFIWFYRFFGENFWIWAWLFFMAFTLFITAFATTVFIPIFNKLTPLEDGGLRSSILKYAEGVNFPLKKIMVMDGSKRSTKANAFFSGLGGQKNIVLYDTLINDHTEEEVVAVLAHEVGHYKKKHTLQTIVFSALTMLLTFWLLHLFIDYPGLSIALGGEEQSLALGLIAFGILYSPISLITSLVMNLISRKNEFEADAYAATTYAAEPLGNALKKLSLNHLSNLQPHPAYVFFNYSHPPVLERLKAMGVKL
jgi:STE24 endopeptidase